MTHPGGRPLKFQSVEDLESRAAEYFASRLDEDGYPLRDADGNISRPVTLTGLCVHLGTTRETLDDYLQRPEYSDSVKWIKAVIEAYYEGRLVYGNSTGSIFALKNFGWKDSQDLNHGGQGADNPIATSLTVSFVKPQHDNPVS